MGCLLALFAVAAVVATIPAVDQLRSEFIADGAPGYGEAASGDHLQTTYRFWLVGHQLEQGGAPWIDPYSFQPLVEPQVVLGGWPYGFPFWPLDASGGPGGRLEPAAPARDLRRRPLHVPVAAGARRAAVGRGRGALAFELAPYRAAPERRPPARVDRRARAPGALGLRAGASRGDGAGRAPLGRARGRRRRLGAALRPAPPRARRAPVRGRVRGPALLAPRVALGLGRRARRRGCRPDRRDRDHLRLDGGRRPDARRGRRSTRRARSTSSAAGACTAPSATSTSAGSCRCSPSRGSCSWLAAAVAWRSFWGSRRSCPPCSRWGRTCRCTRRCGTSSHPCATRASPGGSCRSRTWPSRRSPPSRSRPSSRGSRGGGGRRWRPCSSGWWPPTCWSFRCAPARRTPATRPTRGLADQGPGRVLELPILQRGKGQFGSVYQYYTPAGAAGAADRLRARSRGGLRVHRSLQPPRLRRVAARRP